MASRQDSLCDVIRQLLRADKIKLWLPPYTLEDGFSPGTYAPELIGRYAEVSGGAVEEVVAALESLRQHAIEKLSRRQAGLETARTIQVGEQLRIKVTKHGGEDCHVNVTINLLRPGKELHTMVAQEASLPMDSFRLICLGSVLDQVKGLSEQGVTAGTELLALPLSVEEQREARMVAAQQSASHVRDVAASLANRDDNGDGRYLEICDQHGRPIDMPDNERRSLTLALTLHQKGRRLLHRGTCEQDYQQALALLQECDREFQQCRANILELVDNHGVLYLDICWCQLLLRDIQGLPQAEHRLAQCEHVLRKTYGRNLERLALHKGGKIGAEKLLFGRLHLLQAVAAHFTGRPNVAKELIDQCSTELNSLKVNSEHMAQLLAMTECTEESARVALRACGHNVDRAAMELMEKAEERRHSAQLVAERARRRRRGQKLGRIADGTSWLDAEKYDSLCSMGYPKILCQIALRQCNNNLSAAVSALQEGRSVLEAEAVDIFRESQQQQPVDGSLEGSEADEELVSQGVAMGFDADVIRAGLQHFNMQLQPLIDHLLSHTDEAGFSFSSIPARSAATDSGQEVAAALLFDPEKAHGKKGSKKKKRKLGKAGQRSSSTSPEPEYQRAQEELDEAIERDLIPDLSEEGDIEYLDSTLEQEFLLLHEYRVLISSC